MISKNDFVVSKKSNLWYHIFDFIISHNRFFDITKVIVFFFISQNRICDIKKTDFVLSKIDFVISKIFMTL